MVYRRKLDDLPHLENDEEVKEGKGLKILTPNYEPDFQYY